MEGAHVLEAGRGDVVDRQVRSLVELSGELFEHEVLRAARLCEGKVNRLENPKYVWLFFPFLNYHFLSKVNRT